MAIELVDICKSYASDLVLDRFSCKIDNGSVTCIMGQSGSGKTTLIRIMLGLEQIDSGYVSGLSELRKSVVFQEDRLCENLTAAANIRIVCNKSVGIGSIISAMSALELPVEFAKRSVRSMSGGEKRRIALLRSLMADYDILLMDEPFKGLDADTKDKAMIFVKDQTKGKTVIFVTHDESECGIMGASPIYLG